MLFVSHPFLPRSSPCLRPPITSRRPHWRQCASQSHPSTSLDTFLSYLRQHHPTLPSPSAPTVHLVGTGPGDPGLLTLHSVNLMQNAHVVLYDRLVSPQILSYINPHATMIYVGKQSGLHTRSQADIHVLLRHFAAPGKTVIRLKGGDPFIFGRGGEEQQFLQQVGVQVNTVPGVTAAAGIAAALGIPLTMRGVASSVRFITGHTKEGEAMDVGTVDQGTTLVVYMGLGTLHQLVKQLERGGLGTCIPCVAVENGTTEDQRVVVATLGQLCAKVSERGLKSPTLIIVGEVVKMARVWQEEMGKCLEIGRGREQMMRDLESLQ